MAKIALNSALASLQGGLDNWVYRKTAAGFIVAKRPVNDRPASPAQREVRERFRAASAYATAVLADPVLGPRYAAAAAAAKQQRYPFALGDYLNPPDVPAIDASTYHGAIGDVIKVEAVDRFEVTGVTVVLRDGANAVLEQGAAVLTGGLWHYTATTAVAPGTLLAIEATATDRPGHTGNRTLTLTVA